MNEVIDKLDAAKRDLESLPDDSIEEKAERFTEYYNMFFSERDKLIETNYYSTWRVKCFKHNKGELTKDAKDYLIKNPEQLQENIKNFVEFLKDEIDRLKSDEFIEGEKALLVSDNPVIRNCGQKLKQAKPTNYKQVFKEITSTLKPIVDLTVKILTIKELLNK